MKIITFFVFYLKIILYLCNLIFNKTKMKKITSIWNSPIILTNNEKAMASIVERMLAREDRDIRVNPDDMSYIVHSVEWGYYFIIDSTGIKLSNHGHTVIEPFREKFIELIKEMIKKVTILDREKLLHEIMYNKEQLYVRILENLEKPVNKEFTNRTLMAVNTSEKTPLTLTDGGNNLIGERK